MRTALFISLLAAPVLTQAQEPITIGTRRELFVDGHLIDKLVGAQRRLHHPVPREIAIVHDAQGLEADRVAFIRRRRHNIHTIRVATAQPLRRFQPIPRRPDKRRPPLWNRMGEQSRARDPLQHSAGNRPTHRVTLRRAVHEVQASTSYRETARPLRRQAEGWG